jgi:hypothetical protein
MTAADVLAADKCTCARVNEALTAYCFGDLSADDHEQVSLHVLECEVCWRDVERLEPCVKALRYDPALRPMTPTPETLSIFGLSGRLEQPLAGHWRVALPIAALYGLLYAASVWTELGYSFDRFGTLAWWLSPLAFVWAAGAVLAGMAADAGAVKTGRSGGLRALATTFGILLGLTLALWFALPGVPTIEAQFQTRSAANGYVKNVLLYFWPLLLFILPTFHVVVVLQRQLRAGRHRAVLNLLSNRPEAVSPKGLWIVPQWLLVATLFTGVFIGYQGVNHMLDNLRPGPYAGLFSLALYIRVALWYVIAVSCVIWYQRCLAELKREALMSTRLLESDHV